MAERSVLLALLGVLALQAAWVLVVPPFRGSDEFDHAYRAAAVARGQWVATEPNPAGRGLLVRVPPDLVSAAHAQCAELGYTGPGNCAAVGAPGADGLVAVGSGAGAYPPVFYWVVGSVARPFAGADALLAMRVATALLAAGLLTVAAWAASRCGGWALAGVLGALTPVLLYSTAVAAPNGVEIAAAVGLWCCLLALVRPVAPTERRATALLLGGATLCAAVEASLRLLGPVFVVLTVLTVAAWRPTGVRDLLRERSRAVALCCLVVLASALALAWWLTGPGAVSGPPEARGDGRLRLLGHTVVLWPLQTIAVFPYQDQLAPPAVYVLVGLVAVALVVMALRALRGSRRQMVLAASLVLAVLLPAVATVLTSGGRGVIWQGRYGLPYAVGFVLLAGWALAERRDPGAAEPSPVLPWRVLAPGALAVAIAHGWSLLHVVAEERAHNPASTLPGAWLGTSGPFEPVLVPLLVLLVVLAAGAWVGAVRTASGTDSSATRRAL